MRISRSLLLGLAVAAAPAASAWAAPPVPFANTLYTTDFETDQSGVWAEDTNPGPGAGTHSSDTGFAFAGLDGRTGTGLKVVANTAASAGSSSIQTTLDLSALTSGAITEITGSYQLEVDIWQNYSAAGPGAGTSEFGYIGLNTTPGIATSNFSGQVNSGTYVFTSLDGDVGSDYIVRDSVSPTDGLTIVKDPVSLAPYTLGVDPATIGNGAVINGWTTYTVQYNAGTDTFNWWVDDVLLPFFDDSTFLFLDTDIPNTSGVTSGAVSLGLFDASGGTSANPFDQFVIYDNLVITTENDLLVATLAGDLNGDGFVGIADLNIVLADWNNGDPPNDPIVNPLADPSGDGFVGITDLNVVLGNWNAGVPPGPAVVPEPTTLALLGLGGVAMLRRRR